MAVCTQCGRESPDEFGFCPACGAPLTAASAREVRKVVTVLFCDLSGSTAIGERTDPEALRALMNRYYDAARGVLERHGGTVEKFVGDAVMAVFGIPTASEDDALRATRAAVELRDAVRVLGLEARIGINTGAVVAGEGDTLVTGDAVNVAARLEQAAGTGEILLGNDTVLLVRNAVSTTKVELSLKGKSDVVPAHRLLELDTEAVGVARHLERPMVGRTREGERLRADFEDVVASGSCRLFTLIGPAGIGKSRLVADFLERIDGRAQVARGRALSYGEGITYWPLVEMLLQLGIEPSEAIRSSSADTQLATRALIERAVDRPLVLVIDDFHWAESPMFDLVEHIVDWSRGAPILVLCLARPELLDVRPTWGGGKLNASSVLLEPLGGGEADTLADALLAGVELDSDTRARILATAEGNPLFLEEMASLAREAQGVVDVPPTIHALLQARLDALNDGERTVIERGAVEGQVFHRGAVTALAPEPTAVDVPGQLVSLVRKELVRPDETLIAGDDAFRFRHLLIRDTAYEGLPKAVRAELHERFADWLEANGRLVEQDEILGHHLEQAARYRRELDTADPTAGSLARRAAERLGRAGHASLERGDMHATRILLGRALALVDDLGDRRRVIPDLADALIASRTYREEVGALLDELDDGSAHDRALGVVLAIRSDPLGPPDELLARLDAAQRVLADAGDAIGLVRCETARAWVYWTIGRMGDTHAAWRTAHGHLRRAGGRVLEREIVFGICISAVVGGRHADELRTVFDELEAEAADAGPLLAATVRGFRARVEYGTGEIDAEASRVALDHEIALLEQTGEPRAEGKAFAWIVIPWAEGDVAAAERGARAAAELAERTMFHAYTLGTWAFLLCARGDAEHALAVVDEARGIAPPDDVGDQVTLDQAEAYARALTGENDRARGLLERAAELSQGTDLEQPAFNVAYRQASALTALGDLDGARRLLEGLIERHAARGFHRYADRYRRDLAALDASDRG